MRAQAQEGSDHPRVLRQCLVVVAGPGGRGSGFLVAPDWVLTCAHVVEAAKSVAVTWRARTVIGVVEAASGPPGPDEKLWPFPDLAAVRLDPPIAGANCAWLDPYSPADGTRVYCAGHTFDSSGAAIEFTGTAEHSGRDGPFIRIKHNELREGMSGGWVVNSATGGVCGVLSASRRPGTDMGGLAVPLRGLRDPSLRGVHGEIWRAHDRYHEDEDWPELWLGMRGRSLGSRLSAFEERGLRAILADAPAPDPADLVAVYRSAPDLVIDDDDIVLSDYGDLLTELGELTTEDDRIPHVLEGVVEIARRLPAELAIRLRERALAIVERLYDEKTIDKQATRQLKRRLRAGPRPPAPVSLRVLVRPAPSGSPLYQAELWRSDSDDQIRPADVGPALPEEELWAGLQASLPAEIAKFGSDVANLTVEMILPVGLMDEPFDQWALWPETECAELGRRHRVVLRDAGRFQRVYDPAHAGRWLGAARAPVDQASMRVSCDDNRDEPTMTGFIGRDKSLAVIGLPNSPNDAAGGPARIAMEVGLAVGVPVMIWNRRGCPGNIHEPRDACPASTFHDQLARELNGTPVMYLSERVRQVRRDVPEGMQWVAELALLFDPPSRHPTRDGFVMPGEDRPNG